MSNDEKTKKAVVFIDSLGDDDLQHMPWAREHLDWGRMDAGPVYVTPVVLGSIYTGRSPTGHGLPSISRYGQQSRTRPVGATLPELAAAGERYENVLQQGLPFIVPAQAEPQGNYWHHSGAMGQTTFQPGDAQPAMALPAPAGALDKPGENLDLAYTCRVDHCIASFGVARNLIQQWDADLLFLSYRVADSYAHYHYSESRNDDQTYREGLLTQIDDELQLLDGQAELFVFGDHGARELDEVFRINRWLIERGYLSVDIDHDWREKAVEEGVLARDEDVPGEVIPADAPGVTIDEAESVAIGADPFSTGVTLLDGATETAVEDLIAELSATDAIKQVAWTRDLFGDGSLLAECPDLYAVREEGVFVSGNLHPEPGGPEVTRSGVHHPIGAYGTVPESGASPSGTDIGPADLFDVIAEDFLGLDGDTFGDRVAGRDDPGAGVVEDERDVRQHLEDMGYI